MLRARDETVGAIESPSERSARMTLLADLCARKARIIVAPVAALRQYVIPRAMFDELSITLAVGDEPGWEDIQARLYRLGYSRADVVSAAGEYAVRGGILDVYPATSDAPVRLEFFGDTLESIRPFDLQSQRSDGERELVHITPWLEIPRDEMYRERVIERVSGEPAMVSALRAYLATGADVPDPWLSLAFDSRATILDYLDANAIVVIDEPGMLATIDRSLDEERSREEQVLLAGVESGELDVRAEEVGDFCRIAGVPYRGNGAYYRQ